MIPKIIHYCWVGNRSLPAKYKKYIRGWRKLCPDWTIKEWNEGNIPMDTRPYLANAYRNSKFSNVSNYVRLLAVYNEGGIYLDTDVQLIRNFDPLLNTSCFFGYQESNLINNAIFGATKRHPFIEELIIKLLNTYDGLEEAHLSSPELVSSLLIEKGLDKIQHRPDQAVELDNITIFPIHYFYPYHWTESFSSKCIREDTFAVHHWAATWWSRKKRFKLSIKKLGHRLMSIWVIRQLRIYLLMLLRNSSKIS